jgi:hypothetical protein
MKTKQRRKFGADFKARVVLEAIKGQRTVQEIASHYGVHPKWDWKRSMQSHGYRCRHRVTGFIPIDYEDCRSCGRTRFGAPTSVRHDGATGINRSSLLVF